jgi:hypothetical protein
MSHYITNLKQQLPFLCASLSDTLEINLLRMNVWTSVLIHTHALYHLHYKGTGHPQQMFSVL